MRTLSAVIHAFGPAADVVELTADTTVPKPGRDDVVVRMSTCSINPSDLITVAGAYRARTALPFYPGFEGVGTVVATGADVTGLAVGTRVLPLGSAGSWSTHKRLPARWCFPVEFDDDQAATSYVNPVTAWLLVHGGTPLPGGAGVIVNAATSTIGRMLIRILNERGIAPVAVVRSASAATELLRAGPNRWSGTPSGRGALSVREVLVTSSANFPDRLAAATSSAPPHLLLDAVGGEIAGTLARTLRPSGRLVHYGLLSGVPLPSWTHRDDSGIRVELFRLRDWIHSASRPAITAALSTAQGLVAAGIADSVIDSRYPLRDITAALHRQASPERRGKVLLDMS